MIDHECRVPAASGSLEKSHAASKHVGVMNGGVTLQVDETEMNRADYRSVSRHPGD
jgi:hypothetical protein